MPHGVRMKLLKYISIFIIFITFNTSSNEVEMPQSIVAKFLSSMKDKNYNQASEYITDSDLAWLIASSKPLLNNPVFLEMHGLENLGQSEINEFNQSDIFELWSYIAWESRDKGFGSYDQKNILGYVKESENIAHVVTRGIVNKENDAEVYTLELIKNKWRLKLPRIIKGSVSVFERSFAGN